MVVTPDYQLCPESEFPEIIADLRDFLQWVDTGLGQIPGLDVDETNLAIVGESAGGYLAAQSALLGLTRHARILMLQYPVLDIESHLQWTEGTPEEDKVPVSILDDHLAKVSPGQIVTRYANGERMDLALAMMHNGRMFDLSKDPLLDPMKSLATAGKLPPIFMFHGVDDSLVEVEGSQAWAEKLKRLQPDVPLYTVFRPGPHVLDKHDCLDTAWLREPIEFVERYWPVQL